MGVVRVLRRCLGIVAVVLGLAASANATTATPHGAGTAPVRQTYLQFNMCGNACNHGDLAVVRNLSRAIVRDRPVAVTLNEVCENQYERLRRDLPGYGGRFDPTGPQCGNGTRYGNAVLIHGSEPDPVGSWQLPNPAGDETRRLMCVRGHPPGGAAHLVVCVTHISFATGNIAAQIDAVATILTRLSGDAPTLLGGDFNTDPADVRLNPLYSKGRGTFSEADQADGMNDATFAEHKLDYIFLTEGHWSAARATAIDAGRGLSDHSALLATAIVTR